MNGEYVEYNQLLLEIMTMKEYRIGNKYSEDKRKIGRCDRLDNYNRNSRKSFCSWSEGNSDSTREIEGGFEAAEHDKGRRKRSTGRKQGEESH